MGNGYQRRRHRHAYNGRYPDKRPTAVLQAASAVRLREDSIYLSKSSASRKNDLKARFDRGFCLPTVVRHQTLHTKFLHCGKMQLVYRATVKVTGVPMLAKWRAAVKRLHAASAATGSSPAPSTFQVSAGWDPACGPSFR